LIVVFGVRMDVEKQTIGEMIALKKQEALLDEMKVYTKHINRTGRLRCFLVFVKFLLTVAFLALLVYCLYLAYVYFFGTSSFFSQIFTTVTSFVSCISTPIVCIFPSTSYVNKTYYAPEQDPDPTLVQFLEEFNKCKSLDFGSGTKIWSDQFVLEACGCDVTQQAFQDIKNCTFSGNFSSIAKHCIGLDVPDCKTHIQEKPQFASLPRASAIKVDETWRCEVRWFNWFAYGFLKVVSFGQMNRNPNEWARKCIAKYS